jgi:predicted peroxiredoxin
MLEIDEIIDALTQDNKSPSENIKDIIDKGMVNIYACTFNETVKVL